MEREYQEMSETMVRPGPQPLSQNPSNAPRHTTSSTPPSRGNAQRFGGMHQRRDKRFPLASKVAVDLVPLAPKEPAVPLAADPMTPWKEALMLWLSWNSTQEKLTSKLCKPGQDQKKIEALLDEADGLRQRALDISEKLIREAS